MRNKALKTNMALDLRRYKSSIYAKSQIPGGQVSEIGWEEIYQVYRKHILDNPTEGVEVLIPEHYKDVPAGKSDTTGEGRMGIYKAPYLDAGGILLFVNVETWDAVVVGNYVPV